MSRLRDIHMCWYRSSWRRILVMLALVTLFALALSPDAAQSRADVVTTTVSPVVATSAQGYTNGQGPFLANKPFQATYQRPFWISSFFDHGYPIYEQESRSVLPANLRDTNRDILRNFLGASLPSGNGLTCPNTGVDCYSGHDGFDYTLPDNTPVVAPSDGVVQIGSEAQIGQSPNDRQNTCLVWIDHDASQPGDNTYDFSTVYMHLSSIGQASADQRQRPGRTPNVESWVAGDLIHKGELIGLSGDDACGGGSTGAHLHFGVAAGPSNRQNPQIFDPFGWWSSDIDPWADARLTQIPTLWRRSGSSLWVWAAPQRPAAGEPGYWGDNIEAQTDDANANFQQFGPSNRRSGANGWTAILSNGAQGIQPVGEGAWRSASLAQETSALKRNWAAWGLHVPADGRYRLQAYLPKLPVGANATTDARYTVYVPNDSGGYTTWMSAPVNQQADNQWRDVDDAGAAHIFDLRANTVMLVTLSDVTGTANQAVVFDAVRLRAETPVQPPTPTQPRRVGFALDNSSSMREQGKINAVKIVLPPWIDQLVTSGAGFAYALEPFANNTPTIQQTTDPVQIKAQINALSANDNGVANNDCPEESLGAIIKLAPFVQSGTMLLFTDDLPLSPESGKVAALSALSNNKVKLHAIILPKTCNFGSGNDPAGWEAYKLLTTTTGGTYQAVTTDKTEAALDIVLNEMRAQGQLGAATGVASSMRAPSIQSSSVITYPVTVDDTVTKLNVLLNILSGARTLTVLHPDGTPVSTLDDAVTYVDSGSAQYYEIAFPIPGMWQAVVSGDGDYAFSTSAETPIQLTYLGDGRGTPNVPVTIAARLTGPIATATFTVEGLNGAGSTPVSLRDDGTQNDLVAGDSLYTGWYTPTELGDFQLHASGTTTSGGSFSRVDSRRIRIQGLRVIAPPSTIVASGTSQVLRFTVSNLENTVQTYRISAMSGNGWIPQQPASTMTIAAGGTVDVLVTVQVPADAAANSVDRIWLAATKQADSTIIAEDSTLLLTPDVEGAPPISYQLYVPLAQR